MTSHSLVSLDLRGVFSVLDPVLLEAVAAGVVAGVTSNGSTYANDHCAPNHDNETCVSINNICAADVVCAELI
ncbi:MAG TPA: hypothetical protein VM240_12695 [Verrucomicrobiae bacterium]|nr:hypothetical protein [Verrucomicrobiae bacterium]